MIKLIAVEKIYPSLSTSLPVLQDIDLHVNQGEIFGILGQSGAGKSTLLRCINLLEKPTRGEVWVDGQALLSLNKRPLRHIRQKIGMIFQHFNLLNAKTVYENIALALQLSKCPKQAIEDKVQSLLELTGLQDKPQHYPAELSGGQKQRVAIARALACEPKILLCDEATSALDPQTTQTIIELLKTINTRLNLTIVLITHEMEVVKTLCHRVALLDKGHIIEQAPVADFFMTPQTPLAKKWVHFDLEKALPRLLQARLVATPRPGYHAVLRIFFRGSAASEPLIAHLMCHIGLILNILQANIELLNELPVGIFVAEVIGSQQALQRGVDYLLEKGLFVEIIGYVAASV
jgi:D-methionine transport system ATP-binding protein